MPVRRTRARFIAHQQSIRAGVADQQFILEWNAKTPRQRNAWVEAFIAIERVYELLLHQKDEVFDRVHSIEERVDDVGHELNNIEAWMRWIGHVREAIQEHRVLADVFDTLGSAWALLRNVEWVQPLRANESIQHDVEQEHGARTSIQAVQAEIARMSNFLERLPLPESPAGVRRAPLELLWQEHAEQGQQVQLTRDRDAHMLFSDDDNDRDWEPGQVFGGGMGTSQLWLRFDDKQELIDRVVRKDVFQTQSEWIDPRSWCGDLRKPHDKKPYEIECHQALLDDVDADVDSDDGLDSAVVPFRTNWSRSMIDNDRHTFRYYLQFCLFGDLDTLIEHYREARQFIPEPFIWYVAERLTTAGDCMASGIDNSDKHIDKWEEIVHRDIKPANIFLDNAADKDFPDYPEPLLGDFGIAFRTPPNDPNQPQWWKGAGTPGFIAPEVQPWVDLNTFQHTDEGEIRGKANVFGLGCVLWCLVTNNHAPPATLWLPDPANARPYDLPNNVLTRYSIQLTALIDQCLQYDPGRRPTFDHISNQLENYFKEGPGEYNLTRGMQSGTASANIKEREGLLAQVEEQYKIGMSKP